jgi:uncharacterized protein YcfJ
MEPQVPSLDALSPHELLSRRNHGVEKLPMRCKLIQVSAIIFTLVAVTGCTTPLTTREKGGLLGGVAGAGTGAIIGSTVGHAAVGALIGGPVGLIAGALIGDQLMGQEQRQDGQQRQIDQNRAELERLRRENERLREQPVR